MITNRDKKVIEFVDKYKIATTDTIAELFYPNIKVARRRLKAIYDSKLLKRERDHFTAQYNYYTKKPKQLRHSLLLTEFYRELNKISEIQYFENEYVCDDVRADGIVAFVYRGKGYVGFIEVEISNNGLDVEKYERLYKNGKYINYYPLDVLKAFPLIFAVTNKPIPKTNLKIIEISGDMSNMPRDF